MLQSTSLLRGKTNQTSVQMTMQRASIHFPLAREDRNYRGHELAWNSFNPLPSCEGRLWGFCWCILQAHASIHFPLAREDMLRILASMPWDASIHFPLAREDMLTIFFSDDVFMLQSTSLLRGKTANFTKNCPLLFYNLVCFHHTISYYFYSRYEFRCYLFIISSF